jgi:hypothetical protein
MAANRCLAQGAQLKSSGVGSERTAHQALDARPCTHYAFDLIEHDGLDLRDCPFLERKALLTVGNMVSGVTTVITPLTTY